MYPILRRPQHGGNPAKWNPPEGAQRSAEEAAPQSSARTPGGFLVRGHQGGFHCWWHQRISENFPRGGAGRVSKGSGAKEWKIIKKEKHKHQLLERRSYPPSENHSVIRVTAGQLLHLTRGFLGGSAVKNPNPPAKSRRHKPVPGVDWEDPLEKEMETYSCIFAGKSHGQRSLADYSPRARKESDTT